MDGMQAPPPDQGAGGMPGAGGPEGGMPPGMGAGPPGQAPAATAMSGPTGQEGQKTAGKMVVAHIVLPALSRALVALGATTEEGKSVLDAIRSLSKHFGGDTSTDTRMSAMTGLFGRRGKM